MDHNSGGSNWGTDTTSLYTAVNSPTKSELTSGTDDFAVTAGELQTAYDKFSDTESLDINLVMGGSIKYRCRYKRRTRYPRNNDYRLS